MSDINEAYIVFPGDPEAGIPEASVTVSDMGLSTSGDGEDADIRQALRECFETIYTEPCTVMFDFEIDGPTAA